MNKLRISLLALLLVLLSACSDTIQETIFDKNLETGKYDHSRFDKAKFK